MHCSSLKTFQKSDLENFSFPKILKQYSISTPAEEKHLIDIISLFDLKICSECFVIYNSVCKCSSC
jgi:hypothetical protein